MRKITEWFFRWEGLLQLEDQAKLEIKDRAGRIGKILLISSREGGGQIRKP